MKKEKGITLLALVVTIIVLLILAAVTIVGVVGENGIIKRAMKAVEEHKIGALTEILEVHKGPVAIENLGEVPIEKYIEYVKEHEKLGDDKIEQIDPWQYYVILEEKYAFLIREEDNKDLTIIYMGRPEELPPRITSLNAESTSNKIKIRAEGRRLEEGKYKYYIKREKEEEYGEALGGNETGEYTYEGLEQNHIYYVKVEVEAKYGKAEREEPITTQTITGLTEGNTRFTSVPEEWTNGDVTTTIETDVKEYELEYSKDLKTWEKYNTSGVVSSKNETIYARLTDGSNVGEFVEHEITNIDKEAPDSAVITLSGAGTVGANPEVKGIVKHVDRASGVDILKSRWVLNETKEGIGVEESAYAGGSFASNNQELSFKLTEEKTLYLHVLTIDKAGNRKETISAGITMRINRHKHTGSSSSGGGCYNIPVYHKHSGSSTSGGGCYTATYHKHSGSATTGGGCYTSPYYKYYTIENVYCPGTLRYTGSSRDPNDGTGRRIYVFQCDYCNRKYDSYSKTGAVIGDGQKTISCKTWLGTIISTNKKEGEGNTVPNGATITETTYQVGCGKNETTIEGYNLSCGKTETTIESYNMGCGLQENQIVSYTVSY